MEKYITLSCEEISINVKSSYRGKLNISIDVEVDDILDAIDDDEYILKYLLRYYTVKELTKLANELIQID